MQSGGLANVALNTDFRTQVSDDRFLPFIHATVHGCCDRRGGKSKALNFQLGCSLNWLTHKLDALGIRGLVS